MEILKEYGWIYYINGSNDVNKCGKWMYFFGDKDIAAKLCEKAVKDNIVVQSKHTDDTTGVACFYLNFDDIESHKKVIKYFLDNNLIRRTKAGKLYNIPFKFDNQTRTGEYGDEFNAKIQLSDFIDLNTAEWIN